jgi:hypothetical protein
MGELTKIFVVSSVIDTAVQLVGDSAFADEIGDCKVEFLGEFESICKKALVSISGAQMELFDKKKTRGRKSRDTISSRQNSLNMTKIIQILQKLYPNFALLIIKKKKIFSKKYLAA